MTVHSCTADDGQGVGQQLIDEKGCSTDNFLLKNLEYGDDLVAGQQAHVFKFADKPTIYFACMIRLELKENTTSSCNVSSTDNFLLKNLEYGDDLVAGQQAHVFKFADKPTIYFACMIRLELKENTTSSCNVSFCK
ncbi:hypothetical protein OESDEN_10830 [Oesophagostomum dentatum]|uniref:ZP domain-containing protein n=1 Tax=Oesophagostomum dentatum TaxID=61180 RepID=A0A0B1SVK7_OESDE|nr:hypothetical protein OESDEN_10830 [Oesophagostomum dentatum]